VLVIAFLGYVDKKDISLLVPKYVDGDLV
jgi:hypothetical protein